MSSKYLKLEGSLKLIRKFGTLTVNFTTDNSIAVYSPTRRSPQTDNRTTKLKYNKCMLLDIKRTSKASKVRLGVLS